MSNSWVVLVHQYTAAFPVSVSVTGVAMEHGLTSHAAVIGRSPVLSAPDNALTAVNTGTTGSSMTATVKGTYGSNARLINRIPAVNISDGTGHCDHKDAHR